DQVLLGYLGAEVTPLRQPVGTDDRKREMVPHAGGRLRGKQIAAGRLEELEGRLVLEGGRVCQVDNDLCARQRPGQSLAGDGVDAGVGRRGHNLVTRGAKPVHELRPDEAGASNGDDLHGLSLRPIEIATAAINSTELARKPADGPRGGHESCLDLAWLFVQGDHCRGSVQVDCHPFRRRRAPCSIAWDACVRGPGPTSGQCSQGPGTQRKTSPWTATWQTDGKDR